MSKKHLILVAALLVTAGFAAALLVSDLGDGPAAPPAPPDAGTNAPPDMSPGAAAFDADHVIAVGASITFEDSLTVMLVKIDDSRCPPDVQCVWAGELAPTFKLEGGVLTGTQELRLGTATAQSAVAAPYTLALRGAGETTATIAVAKGTLPPAAQDERIRVTAPASGQIVNSPLAITGEARGTWFFEASFPVRLLDANGAVVATHYAQAQGEWMTTEFVPFSSRLEFAAPATDTGMLVLAKDNPSGLPEHDAEIRIPVRFRGTAAVAPAVECRKTGCSGQICADEDMASDCMFRPEYACYRTATCERQPDGKCGWTQTPALTQCLQNPPPVE